eukprot:Gb_15967 [translate_table: standard]
MQIIPTKNNLMKLGLMRSAVPSTALSRAPLVPMATILMLLQSPFLYFNIQAKGQSIFIELLWQRNYVCMKRIGFIIDGRLSFCFSPVCRRSMAAFAGPGELGRGCRTHRGTTKDAQGLLRVEKRRQGVARPAGRPRGLHKPWAKQRGRGPTREAAGEWDDRGKLVGHEGRRDSHGRKAQRPWEHTAAHGGDEKAT